MKIQILSDLHLEFGNFAFVDGQADVIVLAGDIHVGEKGVRWALETIPNKPVIYILGNHEYYRHAYPKLTEKLKDLTKNTNVHLLENDKIHIQGVTFYGCTLWSDFNLFGNAPLAKLACEQQINDFRQIRIQPTYSRIRSIQIAEIFSQSLSWLQSAYESESDKNVVITHHAPSGLSIPARFKHSQLSAAYASNLDPLICELSPDLWIHGHMHDSLDYMIENTRIICNPRGYDGAALNPGFIPDMTVEI